MTAVSRSRSAFLGIITTQLFTILSMVVSIISTPLMVTLLDKEAYGLYILFFQLSGYLALFDFGFSAAVILQLTLHRGDDEKTKDTINRLMTTGLTVGAGMGGVVTVVGCCFAPFVPSIFDMRPALAEVAVPIVMSISLLAGVQFLQRCLGGIFYAHHRQALVATPGFVLTVANTVITVGLLAMGVGLWAYVYANLFQIVVGLGIQLYLVRRYYPDLKIAPRFFDRELLRQLFGQGIFMFLHGLATQVILNTDRLVIGKVVSLTAVSAFTLTVRIPEIGMSLMARVTENVTPAIMEIAAHESAEQMRQQYKRLMTLVTTMGMMAFWLMIAFNAWFLDLWLGPGFFAGRLVLALALVLMVQQSLLRSAGFFLYAKNFSRQMSFMAMAEAALNITISIFLGRQMGLAGVLLGTLIAALLTSGWYTPYLLRRYLAVPLSDSIRSVLVPALGISVMGLGLYVLVNFIRTMIPSNIFTFGLLGAAAGLVLLAFSWLLFLRRSFAVYVPAPLRRYLLVSNLA